MIHSSAIISSSAKIGADVQIGPFTIVHPNVEIGDRTVIGSHCEIGVSSGLSDGTPLIIGSNGLIRSHSVFYQGSSFGDSLVTGHRVTVREGTKAGRNLQIGTLSDIQGDCLIGDYVRFHSNVHVGKMSKIGNFVWIFPYVVLTNDPHPPSNLLMGVTIEDFSAIATMSVVLPGVTIKRGALVGAHSSVNRDVEADTLVAGSPAKFICNTDRIRLKNNPSEVAYPWRRHFHRGYPSAIVDEWIKEFS